MAFTYDLSTAIGLVRLLIPDRVNTSALIFSDDEITALLTAESDSVKSATALALETIASNEAMVQKVQTTLGETTDGAKTATALLARAKVLREQAESPDVAGSFSVGMTRLDGYALAASENEYQA